ncbi:MAG: hypothetical protein GF344_19430, partial [Chitinivibrionales bacterium]|nr:hypothetical protein [Chitinivibrionales bacterium]MBD3358798.1 hypothetical protein [Chitinivibrionales bacterium]
MLRNSDGNTQTFEDGIFCGQFDEQNNRIDKTFVPVANCFVLIKQDKSAILCRTNGAGILKQVHYKGEEIKATSFYEAMETVDICIISPETASLIFAQPSSTSVHKKVSAWISHKDVELNFRQETVTHVDNMQKFIKPDSVPSGTSLPNRCDAILIPSQKVVLFRSKSKYFKGASFQCKLSVNGKGRTFEMILDTNDQSKMLATLFDKNDEYIGANAIITIPQNEFAEALSLKKDFEMTTVISPTVSCLGFEIAEIDIAPITLEESLILQFPNRNLGKIRTEVRKGPQSPPERPTAAGETTKMLDSWKSAAKAASDKLNKGMSFINPSSSRFALLDAVLNEVFRGLRPEDRPTWLGRAIQLSTGGGNLVAGYLDFLKKVDELNDTIDKLRTSATSVKSAGTTVTAGYLGKMDVDDSLLLSAASDAAAAGNDADDILIAKKGSFLDQIFGSRGEAPAGIEKLGKVTNAAGIAFDVYDTARSIMKAANAARSLEEARKNFTAIIEDFDKLGGSGASREVLSVLEKFRQFTLAARKGADKATIEAINAGVNLAMTLTVAAFPPAAAPVAAIQLTKAGIRFGADVAKSVGTGLDKLILDSKTTQFFADLQRSAAIRQDDMREFKEILVRSREHVDDMGRQFIVRARVLNALVRLIERAGSRVNNANFEKAVKDNKIVEFIRCFVFNEYGAWSHPAESAFPISLDHYWQLLIDYCDTRNIAGKSLNAAADNPWKQLEKQLGSGKLTQSEISQLTVSHGVCIGPETSRWL